MLRPWSRTRFLRRCYTKRGFFWWIILIQLIYSSRTLCFLWAHQTASYDTRSNALSRFKKAAMSNFFFLYFSASRRTVCIASEVDMILTNLHWLAVTFAISRKRSPSSRVWLTSQNGLWVKQSAISRFPFYTGTLTIVDQAWDSRRHLITAFINLESHITPALLRIIHCVRRTQSKKERLLLDTELHEYPINLKSWVNESGTAHHFWKLHSWQILTHKRQCSPVPF